MGRKHFAFLHRWLFQDVYEWAGEFRNVPINKDGSEFAQPRFLGSEANRIFGELALEHKLRYVAEPELPERLAYYFGEINALHPFREGNGRVQRLFLSHILEPRELLLGWADVRTDEMIDVSIAAHQGDPQPARRMFARIVRHI